MVSVAFTLIAVTLCICIEAQLDWVERTHFILFPRFSALQTESGAISEVRYSRDEEAAAVTAFKKSVAELLSVDSADAVRELIGGNLVVREAVTTQHGTWEKTANRVSVKRFPQLRGSHKLYTHVAAVMLTPLTTYSQCSIKFIECTKPLKPSPNRLSNSPTKILSYTDITFPPYLLFI